MKDEHTSKETYRKPLTDVRDKDNIKTRHLKDGVSTGTLDTITGYLVNRKTNRIACTKISKVVPSEVKNLKKKGWFFDWKEPLRKGYEVYKITLARNNKIQGLIALVPNRKDKAIFIHLIESAPHNIGNSGVFKGVGAQLFALAAWKSINCGFGGYVYFDAKTKLINYYKKTLNAMRLGNSQRMYLNPKASKKLIQKCFCLKQNEVSKLKRG